MSAKFEYVVACQMYHHLKMASSAKAEHIDELRHNFPERLRVAYVEVVGQGKDASFASVLLGADPARPGVDIVLYKVKLPGHPILGEGKPENQNQAIIFTRGEHLQTLDMNQDNYLGEAYKMRNLLECFKGRVRIVGFREHIFSESGGAVAHFAASNEFVFGTMVQRFLTWPLCVRFHYGHPDLWDKVWALSSGGVSKASRTLHVSEDIYGGLNAVLRGGGVEYEEYIHCGKARDITFAASNSFEQKISGGNAWQGMSRDFHRAAKSFDLFRLLSLFVTGTGLFATSSLMFWALGWFTLALTGFALVGLESFTVDGDEVYFDITGTGGSEVYSAQWFVQLGFTLVFPLFLEHAGTLPTLVISPLLLPAALPWGPNGPLYLLWPCVLRPCSLRLYVLLLLPTSSILVPTVTGTMGLLAALKEIGAQLLGFKFLFTIFQERTRAYYLHQGLTLGSARYIATGRGYTMSSNFVKLFAWYGCALALLLRPRPIPKHILSHNLTLTPGLALALALA